MEFLNEFVPNAVIVVICVLLGMAMKWGFDGNSRLTAGIPWLLAVAGAILGIIASFVMEEYAGIDILTAIAMGAVSGLAAGGAYQVVRQQQKLQESEAEEMLMTIHDLLAKEEAQNGEEDWLNR